MARTGYRRAPYGMLPWWVLLLLGLAWLGVNIHSYRTNSETESYEAEPVYLRFIDRELRLLEDGETRGPFWRWLSGADNPADMLARQRDSLLHLRDQMGLRPDGANCLAALQVALGEEREARELLKNYWPRTVAGRVLRAHLEHASGSEVEHDRESLREEVASGKVRSWEVRILRLVSGEGEELPAEVFEKHRGVNARLFDRGQRLIGVGLGFLVLGVCCLPWAVRGLKRAARQPVARIAKRWSVPFVLGAFFGAELIRWLLSFPVGLGLGMQPAGPWSMLSWIAYTLWWQSIVAVILMVIVFRSPLHMTRAFGLKRPVPWTAIWAAFPVLGAYNLALYTVLGSLVTQEPTDILFWSDPGGLELAYMVLSGCVAAPIFEEIIFRGFLFTGLRRSLGPWPALAISTVLFAVIHHRYDPVGMASVGGFGLVCGVLTWRTGSILPGIILHSLYNIYHIGGVYLMYQAPLWIP